MYLHGGRFDCKIKSMINKKSAETIVPRQPAGEGLNLTSSLLNPYYIAGFVDGEGSFVFFLSPRKDIRLGFELNLDFQIEVRIDDKEILERIKKTLGCGHINVLNYERYKKWMPHVKYRVGRIEDLRNKLVPFFRRYPLQAKKKKNESDCANQRDRKYPAMAIKSTKLIGNFPEATGRCFFKGCCLSSGASTTSLNK